MEQYGTMAPAMKYSKKKYFNFLFQIKDTYKFFNFFYLKYSFVILFEK